MNEQSAMLISGKVNNMIKSTEKRMRRTWKGNTSLTQIKGEC